MVVRRKRKNGGRGGRPAKRRRFATPVAEIKRQRKMARGGGMGPRTKRQNRRKGGAPPSGMPPEIRVIRGAGRMVRTRSKYGKKRRTTVRSLMALAVPNRVLIHKGTLAQDRIVLSTTLQSFYNCGVTAYTSTTTDISTAAPTTTVVAWPATSVATADQVVAWVSLPIYAFELTFSDVASEGAVGPLWRMWSYVQSQGAGLTKCGFKWFPDSCQDKLSAVTQSQWQVEKANYDTSLDPGPVGRDIRYVKTEWVELQMILSNAGTQQTYYETYVSNFTDREFFPDVSENDLTGQQIIDRQRAYYEWAVPLVNGSMLRNVPRRGRSAVGKKMMYKRHVFGKEDTRLDASADTVNYRLFLRDGKIRNHAWAKATPLDYNKALMEVFEPVRMRYLTEDYAGGRSYNTPHWKQRRWFFVQAFDPTRTATSGAEDTGSTGTRACPCFDLIVRKKEHLQGNAVL